MPCRYMALYKTELVMKDDMLLQNVVQSKVCYANNVLVSHI
jgi:hypothetical protein